MAVGTSSPDVPKESRMSKPFVLLNAIKLHQGPHRLPTGNFQLVLHLAEALARRSDLRLIILTDQDSHGPLEDRVDRGLLHKTPLRGNSVLAADYLVVRAVRKFRPDIYHRPAGQLPLWPLHCKTISGIADLSYMYLPHSPLMRLYKEISYRWTARSADRILCISKFTRDDVVQKLSVPAFKARVVYLGANRLPPPDDAFEGKVIRPFFLAFGHQAHKNVESVLHAIARIGSGASNARLSVVGKNGHVDGVLKPMSDRLGIRDRVDFLDAVSPSALAWLYANAIALVFPSRFEGFGLPVLEAMLAGCPVICSNTCSLPEIAGEAAIQVRPDDLDAISSAMQQLLDSPALGEKMRVSGRLQARSFTWDNAAARTAEVYHELHDSA